MDAIGEKLVFDERRLCFYGPVLDRHSSDGFEQGLRDRNCKIMA